MSERSYKPILVIDPEETNLPVGYTFALRVRPGAEMALPRWINGEAPFLLLLQDTASDALGLCLFSPRYLRIGGRPVVGMTAPMELPESWGDVLKDSASLIRQADLETFDPVADFYRRADRIGNYIFFEGLDVEVAFFQACLGALERMGVSPGTEGEALLLRTLSAYADALARVKEAEEAQKVTADRLKSAQVIVSVIRTKYKDDYDTLYNWHHDQYTVLPLWYKRVGQVVKVLTGKRTLWSLFSK